MNRGIFGTGVLATVVALAFAAPATADTADAVAAACAKQTRAVATAKKAVTKAQKAKATTPKARKQRARRVKAAKAKHARAKKALASCRKKAGKPAPPPAPVPAPAPAPMPVPAPAPKPVPPVLAVKETTIKTTAPWVVAVIVPETPAGTQYRLRYDRPQVEGAPPVSSCVSGVTVKITEPRSVHALFNPSRPWCVGAGTISLHRVADAAGNDDLGETLASVPVEVVP